MSEAAKGESSHWYPYLAALPTKLDSLVFWSKEELSELQASTVVNKIGRAHAEEEFTNKIAKLSIPGANLESFHNMASLIMAYAFDIPERQNEAQNEDGEELVDDEEEQTMLTMIPLADMLNADADRNNARLMCDGEDLEMRAIKNICKGDEIFNDYGQLPRSDLLRRYGYITSNYKQYDVAEISSGLVTSAFKKGAAGDHCFMDNHDRPIEPLTEAQLTRRIDLAMREDVFEDSYDLMHADSDSPGVPDELLALTWILAVNDETFHALENSETSLPSRSKLSTNFVGCVLNQVFKLREQEYQTTLEEDDAILAAGNTLSHRKYMAVQVRRGEKEILREAIQEVATFQADNKRMRNEPSTEKKRRSRDDETLRSTKKRRG